MVNNISVVETSPRVNVNQQIVTVDRFSVNNLSKNLMNLHVLWYQKMVDNEKNVLHRLEKHQYNNMYAIY